MHDKIIEESKNVLKQAWGKDFKEKWRKLVIGITASCYVHPVVTGGTLSSDATYYYRDFTSGTSNLVVSDASLSVDYLIVAGGGSGGSSIDPAAGSPAYGAGGGAGGVITGTIALNGTYPIVIGAGGVVDPGAQATANGANTTAFSLTAIGGGGGCPAPDMSGSYDNYIQGNSGGSGGGSFNSGYTFGVGGAATSGQGYAGGEVAYIGTGRAATGGGGAGSVGEYIASASGIRGYNGGTGVTALGLTVAGGGGGSGQSAAGTASAGGGAGRTTEGANSATANTGGGGGGAFTAGTSHLRGGAGGSGIVRVRYLRSAVGG